MPAAVSISTHVVEQWVARVDRAASRQDAGRQIQRFLAGAYVAGEDADGGGLYLAHPSWPGWRIVLRPRPVTDWVARTVVPRLSLEELAG